ncbi:MAG: sodium:solute symporter [Phycisphaerales bacterium]|jgi:SSS family transporter|nr:sodium:solute symporter [Phycisphaerales bacterium]
MPTDPAGLAASPLEGARLGFAAADWGVLAAYFVVILVSGWLLGRRKQSSTDDYFLAGRRMPAWAVACSVLATALSAATFVGVPEVSFTGNLTYLSANIGGVIAILIVATFFIPAFYRANVSSVYQLLGARMGPGAQMAGTWTYMLGRVLAGASRIYIGAIPLAMVVFGDDPSRPVEMSHIAVAIVALCVVGAVYTLAGGIASVIWADVIQTIVFVGAILAAIVVLLQRIPVPIPELISALHAPPDPSAPAMTAPSKLTLLSTSTDPSRAFTLWTALTGFVLLSLGPYGTDQDLVQRTLTCKSPLKGSQSAIAAIVLSIPVVALFLIVGLLLHVFYARPDLMGDAAPGEAIIATEKVFPQFILHELRGGLAGLLMAGLFASGLSTINSSLNSMSATLVTDVYMRFVRDKSPRHYVAISRFAVLGWSVVLTGVAMLCALWQRTGEVGLIDFALSVMSFAYAGLIAVFLSAIFTRRGNSWSAIAAIVVGFVSVLAMQPWAWRAWASCVPLMPGPSDVSRTLADINVAYPWHLCIGTVLAFAVCQLGRRTSKAEPSPT